MVAQGDSIYSILQGSEVPVVGQFKLSEIENIDQLPLAFEFLKGKTYAKKGEKTVRLKGIKSGWDKRMYTL
jgi:hypothetical protein